MEFGVLPAVAKSLVTELWHLEPKLVEQPVDLALIAAGLLGPHVS